MDVAVKRAVPRNGLESLPVSTPTPSFLGLNTQPRMPSYCPNYFRFTLLTLIYALLAQ